MKTITRSADVRREARARLHMLRQERLGRKRGMTVAHDVPVHGADAGSDGSHEAFAGAATAATANDARSIPHALPEDAQPEGSEWSDEAPDQVLVSPADAGDPQPTDPGDAQGDASDDPEPTPGHAEADPAASPDGLFGDARSGSAPGAATEKSGETGDGAGPDVDQPEGPERETDLMSIPGAGPGLIWMFSNASVRSLDDLAQADVEELTAALGPVGQILDVAQLIDFARQHTGWAG